MENNSNILIYQTEDGQTKIQTRLEDETVWLTQEQMAELFQRDRTVISKHIKHIFNENELDENMVCANFAHTTKHGAIEHKTQTTHIKYYNLDVIISVGYRVKSLQGTKFRQWATARLKEYIVKGFTMNDELLKNAGGGNDIESIELLSHMIKDINKNVKILAKVTKISALPETIDSENFVDIYDCTAELLVEKAR